MNSVFEASNFSNKQFFDPNNFYLPPYGVKNRVVYPLDLEANIASGNFFFGQTTIDWVQNVDKALLKGF